MAHATPIRASRQGKGGVEDFTKHLYPIGGSGEVREVEFAKAFSTNGVFGNGIATFTRALQTKSPGTS
jgi:hypothetical protein